MKRARISSAAAALVLGLAGILAGAMPASAGSTPTPIRHGRHLPTVVARPAAPSGFSLESVLNINVEQRCIGISSSHDAGAWNCTYINDQLWHLGGQIDGNSGYYQFINARGQCLGVAGGSQQREALVVGWTCNGHPDQYWGTVELMRGSVWILINWNSGYAVDLKNGNLANGATIWQYTWDDTNTNPNQQWSVQASS